MILVDLIYNLALLVALSVVSGFVDARWKRNTRAGALLQGVVFGGAAVIGMLRPFVFAPGLIFDGRSVMISLGGLFFGPWAAAVACLMTIPLRIYQGGSGMGMGVLVILASAAIGVGFHLRRRRKSKEVPAFTLLWFGVLVHLAMLAMTLALPADLILPVLKRIGWPVMLAYPLATVLIGKILSDQAARGQSLAALRESAHRVRESERKYRELVENANSIILRWGRDGRVTFLNEFGQRFFGYTEAEIRGRHVMGTIVPETEDGGRGLDTLMEQICADPAAFEQNVNENIRRNGERVWIAWTNKVVLDAGGQVVEILSIGTDITAQKRAEEELRATQAGLEQRVIDRTAELAVAKERAEQADSVKSAFLASMSHELRTPLNSIIGFTGILLQGLAGPTNEEQTKQLGMVQSSARHLLSLINDVLDLSKIEAGQLHVTLEPVSMSEVAQSVVKALMPLAREKSLALEAEVSPDVGAFVSDRRRVEQVLINLVGNAVKFTDKGQVRIGCRIDGDCVETSVVDTGMGISPEDVGRLFQMFQQIPAGQPRAQGGTGLGLSISKKLVEMLGGRIWVESQPGVGSKFKFTLPLNKGDSHETDSAPR